MPTVNLGLIDFLISPPIGYLQPILDPRGPYGEGDTRLTDTGIIASTLADTRGLLVEAYTIPPAWGRRIGYNDPLGRNLDLDVYSDTWGQLAIIHTMIGGKLIADQQLQLRQIVNVARYLENQPTEVGLHIAPGWAADVYWLFVL